MTLNINDIELGEATEAGHKTYLNAYHHPRSAKKRRHLIVKSNKYGKPAYSRFEVGFSQLAFLYLGKKTTVQQELVLDAQGAIVAVASEHIAYSIAQNEGLKSAFYCLDKQEEHWRCRKHYVARAEELPVYFLNKLPHGFFAQLVAAEKKGQLGIDYSSLARILTGSYTLEEDDLHKGNFGFYLVEKQGKAQAVFFKVDHDLMFTNSVMSFHSIRPQHLFYDEQAFDISAEDLLNFPNISDSANSYWPTKQTLIPCPWSDKDYQDSAEVAAFAGLADNPEFKRAKWLSFYKHILIPPELNKAVLEQSFDRHQAKDRAHMALILQAMTARQAKLKARLYSLPEFQSFLKELSLQEKQNLFAELLSFCPQSEQATFSTRLHHALFRAKPMMEEGDNALHAAIKLGAFRYEESLTAFGHLINQPNKAGKTPLDCAVELAVRQKTQVLDVAQDARLIMRYLLRYGAYETGAFKAFNVKENIETYQFRSAYLHRAQCCCDYAQLKDLLREIGEDQHYCLKGQKKLAVAALQQFIAQQQTNPDFATILGQLKRDINDAVPELKYIRQLRSSLWIVRQLRGLYGWTSTQGEMNSLINQALAAPRATHQQAFFSREKGRVEVSLEGQTPSTLCDTPGGVSH